MALTRPKIWDLDTNIEYFKDPLIVLHQGATDANVDVGFVFNRANGLVSNVALFWSEQNQSFITAYTNDAGTIDSNVSIANYADFRTSGIYAEEFFWANGTPFASSSYGNTDVSAYLLTAVTDIQGGNLVALGNVVTTDGIYWSNGTPFVSFPYSATSAPPNNPIPGSVWYDTGTGGVFEFQTDGTSSYWIDVSTPILSTTSSGGSISGGSNYTNGDQNINGNLTTTGSITTDTFFYGNGYFLTGVSGSGGSLYGNVDVANYLPTYAGNVSAQYVLTNHLVYGNGQPYVFGSTYSNANVAGYLTTYTGNVHAGNILTNNLLYPNGKPFSFGSTYSNANVASYLTSYTGNLSAGNISTGNFTVSNISAGNITVGNINVNTITAGYFLGNAFYATGVISSYGNANVAAYLPAYIPTDAIVQAIQANVVAANLAIVTANTGVVSYVNSIRAGLIANINSANTTISTVSQGITAANIAIAKVSANVTAANIAIVSLATGANANTAAYLTTYTGNLSAGNLNVVNLTYTNTEVITTTESVQGAFYANAGIDSTGPMTGAVQVTGGISATGNLFIGGNVGNLVIDQASGISASGSFGGLNQVLSSIGTQGVFWADTVTQFVNNNWIDLTNISVPEDYQINVGLPATMNLGSYTLFPNQDSVLIAQNLFPEPFGSAPGTIYNSSNIALGSIFYQYSNPTTYNGDITDPSNQTAVYMWISPDGTGSPYWGGNAFWFPITSPTGGGA